MGSLISLASDLWPDISGYIITERLYIGSRTAVYRAVQADSQRPVVIKILRQAYPSFGELVQFRNQYTIAKNLPSAGIVRPLSLESVGSGYALVMEDFGGISLGQYIQQQSLDLIDVLAIALQLAEIFEDLCQYHVVHKDIKPDNILIHPESKQVKLIDFSIASLLPKETQEIQSPNILEGTLAYLAPEQTGRMNRGIDYRADFYALGVTLYQLLCGELPFVAEDPLELVYCHIAKMPASVNQVNSAVPEMVGAIVAKLMAKNAEDRYQSAIGLKHDLQQCLTQCQETDDIPAFELGQRDLSDRFLIPEKLYGREPEVQSLLAAFDRVASPMENHASQGTTEMMLVAGFSGIGKTAVVNEVHKPVTQKNGYFINGKFEQFNRNIPFSAFVQAFRGLMGELLSESDDNLQIWKNQVLNAVGDSGQVIIKVIPELERVIGPQPPATELSGTAAQNRFNLLFQKFIQVFTTPEHPLVMFLDDLQWADSASLSLIQVLMAESKTGYLLLIGAYRDNEVFAAHPLMLTLDAVSKVGARVNTITLQPLTQSSLNRLVADTLHCDEPSAMPLTELVMQKTQGNPFFATQFLKALHQEKLIAFDAEAGCWQWDIIQVRDAALTDDVVEFMALQLEKLPTTTQNVLKLAACIGAQFDLQTLAIVSQQSPAAVATALWKALQEGLILPQNETYKFYMGQSTHDSAQALQTINYKFLHDRVQQAAYFLIPEEQKQSVHLQIGRLLLENSTVEGEGQIFAIVNQLNQGLTLIELSDRELIARLNLQAGKKANSSTAYQAALNYLLISQQLLNSDSWESQYSLSLEISNQFAFAAYLVGDFERMEQTIDQVIRQSRSVLDQVTIYEIKIQALIVQGQMLSAVKTALFFMHKFGVKFPLEPTTPQVLLRLAETKISLLGKSIQTLENLPTMTDPYKIAIVQILSKTLSATYISAPDLMPLLVFRNVNIFAKYGNINQSSLTYSFYALILCGVLQDIETGYKFGQLALKLLNKFDSKEIRPRVIFMIHYFIHHYKNHLNTTLSPLLEAYQTALEIGDTEYGAWSAISYCIHTYYIGKELSEVNQQLEIYTESCIKTNQESAALYCNIFAQTVLCLSGKVKTLVLEGEAYCLSQRLVDHQARNDKTGLFFAYTNQSMLGYLFGDFDQARLSLEQARLFEDGGIASPGLVLFYFYDSLTCLAQFKQVSRSDQHNRLKQLATNQKKMKLWASYAPMNYLHKYHLIEAERHQILNKRDSAIDFYDRAIAGAKENQYIQEEALANELAAKFYLDWGKEKVAAGYMQEAYYCYARWGAKAKTDRLETEYPQLLQPILQQVSSTFSIFETVASLINQSSFSQYSTSKTSSNKSSSSHSLNQVLDSAALLQVSQAISSTIDLDELLQTLTQTMLKTSGGDRCALVLFQDNQWQVRAIANLQETILESVPLENNLTVPIRLIQYIKNTSETVVINNLITDLPGVIGAYLRQYHPKSVLGLPILNQGNLVGILYLENSLVSGVFTNDRLLALNFLATQAAISLENSRLYQLEQQRFQQLQEQTSLLTFRSAIDSNLTRSGTLQEMLQRSTEIVVDHLDAAFARIWTVSADGNILELQASAGLYTHLDGDHSQVPIGQFKIGLIAQECRPYLTNDVLNDPQVGNKAWAASEGMVSFAGYPLLVNNQVLGVIALFARRPLETSILDALAIATYEISLGLDRKQTEIALQISESHLRQKSQDLEQALEEVEHTQLQMIQSEKMSALGNLVAGVAHEINNPMGFLNGSIKNVKDYTRDLMGHLELYQQHYPNPVAAIQDDAEEIDLEFLSEDLPKLLNSMTAATDRIKNISTSLRNFSRADTEYKVRANLHEGIDSTLLILKYRLKANQHRPEIQVHQAYGELPSIQCFPGQLNQVFMNILANAIDMFDEMAQESTFTDLEANPQIITIKTAATALNTVEIYIHDNGKGMSEEIRHRIFDHLFTTKGVGKGTGLGLAIARQIVLEKHGGGLEVSSGLNQGTEFCISLPILIE